MDFETMAELKEEREELRDQIEELERERDEALDATDRQRVAAKDKLIVELNEIIDSCCAIMEVQHRELAEAREWEKLIRMMARDYSGNMKLAKAIERADAAQEGEK